MQVDAILGLQWGDEGKGKIVDYLSKDYDIVARFQGGPNAGHTLKIEGRKFVLHTVPSGIFRPRLLNLIGNGVVIDPITLRRELEELRQVGVDYEQRLLVSRKAHLILPTHRYLDAASEASKGKAKIGSTLKGIGPTYMDKTGRNGLRVGDIESASFREKYQQLKEKHLGLLRGFPPIDFDLEGEEKAWFESLEELRRLQAVDGEYFINGALQEGKRILAEGAQGSMLDIDFGTYPYVTSSNTIAAGVCLGLGVAPARIRNVIGIAKAYCTRVGGGPFPTELHDEAGRFLQQAGNEFGATTGRPRRCGWLDLTQLRYSIMLNGVTHLVITKIDVLNELPEIQVATHYRLGTQTLDTMPFDLCESRVEPLYTTLPGWQCSLDSVNSYEGFPKAAQNYIQFLEEQLGVPITMVSTGPGREQLVLRPHPVTA